MKQLLLLFAIHFIIFYQQGKDQKEKIFVTLEKKNVGNTRPQKDWNFIFQLQETAIDTVNFSRATTGPVLYDLRDHDYLMAK